MLDKKVILSSCGILAALTTAANATSAHVIEPFVAAQRISGVDKHVIKKIIKNESGGNPYAINTNSPLGSFYFKNRGAAEEAILMLKRKGYRSLDIGLAQVNTRWHPELDPIKLLDPSNNIIAAGYVLKKNSGGASDLREIVGRYHSKTPSLKTAYTKKILGE